MHELFKKRTKVILDTNFLMIPGELGIDVLSEIQRIMEEPYEICILDKSLEELQAIIAKSNGKEGFNAKLGYIMAKQKSLKTLTSSKGEYADKALLRIASERPENTVIATQDRELIKAIKDVKARALTLRQKKTIIFA